VLSTIVERAVVLSGADAAPIYRYRRSERVFRLGTSTGFGDALAAAIRGVRIREEETTAMARAVAERVPVQIPISARRRTSRCAISLTRPASARC